MNSWECSHPGCTSSAVGVGGAIGLRAIGWYFHPGPHLFCPAHRPDARVVRTELHSPLEDDGTPCSPCTAYLEAAALQLPIHERFGW